MNQQQNTVANPFEGQGGSFYINPKGSNTLKRDRNAPAPFAVLSDVEKAARIHAVPKHLMSEKDRADHLARLALPATETVTNSSQQSATSSAEPAAGSPAAAEATDKPAATKKGSK